MALLRSALLGVHLPQGRGVWCVAAATPDSEVLELAAVLASLLDTDAVQVPWSACRTACWKTAPHQRAPVLAVLDVATQAARESVIKRLGQTGAQAVVVRGVSPSQSDVAHLAGLVDDLAEPLSVALADPAHSLAHVGLAGLDVRVLAGACDTPMDLSRALTAIAQRALAEQGHAEGPRPWTRWAQEAIAGLLSQRIEQIPASQRDTAAHNLVLCLDDAHTLELVGQRALHRVGLVSPPGTPASWSRLAVAMARPGVRMALLRAHPNWPWRLVRPTAAKLPPDRMHAARDWASAVALWCLRADLEPGFDALGARGLCQAVEAAARETDAVWASLRPWLDLLGRLATGRGPIAPADLEALASADTWQVRLAEGSTAASGRFAVAALFDTLAVIAAQRAHQPERAVKRWAGLSWTMGRLGGAAAAGLAWLQLRMCASMAAFGPAEEIDTWRAELAKARQVLGVAAVFRPALEHVDGWLAWASGDAAAACAHWHTASLLAEGAGDATAAARYGLDCALAAAVAGDLGAAAQAVGPLAQRLSMDAERGPVARCVAIMTRLAGVGTALDPDDAFATWQQEMRGLAEQPGGETLILGALVRCGALLSAGRTSELLPMLDYLGSASRQTQSAAPRTATRIAQAWCLRWLADSDGAVSAWQQAARGLPKAAQPLAARIWHAIALAQAAEDHHVAAAGAMVKALELHGITNAQAARAASPELTERAQQWLADPSWPSKAKGPLRKLLVAMTLLIALLVTACGGKPAPMSRGDVTAADAKGKDTAGDGLADSLPPSDAIDAHVDDAAAATQDGAAADSLAQDASVDVADVEDVADAPDGSDLVSADAAPDAADTTADAAVQAGLALTVTGPPALAGTLHIVLFTPQVMLQPNGPMPSQAKLLKSAPLGTLPWTGQVALPVGTWVLGAFVSAGPFDPLSATAVAVGCSSGKSIGVTSDGTAVTPAALSIALIPMDQMPSIAQLCGGGLLGGAPQSLFEQTFQTTPPSTQAGGAHLLDGVAVQGSYWVAGHQDGYVTFSLDGITPPVGTADWQTHPKGLCSRLVPVGEWLACSSRHPQLGLAKPDKTTGKPTVFQVIQLDNGVLADGMGVHNGRLVIAAHAAGLATRAAVPPFGALPLQADLTLTDAWDVASVDASHLAIADGAKGVIIASVAPNWQLTAAATVPLGGLSTGLRMEGQQLLVGSASGRISLISVVNPDKPVLQWSLPTPWPIYGVSAGSGLALAAGGPALWALDLPPAAAGPGDPTVRDVEFSYYYAMDIDPLGSGVVSAEFAAVRTLSLYLKAPVAPQPIAAKAIYAKPAAVGTDLQMNLRVWSVGSEPVQVVQIGWVEDASGGAAATQIAGAQKIAPHAYADFALTAPKTLKGVTTHLLKVKFDPPGETIVQVKEVTSLLPGDPLPALQFPNADGKSLDVNKYLAGKPGVVIVAAHSCPVAFQALAALAVDLGDAVKAQTLRTVAIDPWNKPSELPELGALKAPFPVLFSPLSSNDNHEYSKLLQDTLAQPTDNAAPMPIVYVVDATGKIVDCRQGYEPQTVAAALAALGAPP